MVSNLDCYAEGPQINSRLDRSLFLRQILILESWILFVSCDYEYCLLTFYFHVFYFLFLVLLWEYGWLVSQKAQIIVLHASIGPRLASMMESDWERYVPMYL